MAEMDIRREILSATIQVFNKKGIKLDDVFYAFYKSDSLFVITNDDLL